MAKKIAILGGGVAALTAAYALSELNTKGHRFDITVYQLGWRLGGKTASGRNGQPGHGQRIEEHGLHIWAGFYENAFTVLRSALLALDRPPGTPQATIEQAFQRQNDVFLAEEYQDTWLPWPIWFQPDADPTLYPGRDDILAPPDSVMPSLLTLISRAIAAYVFNSFYYAFQWPDGVAEKDASSRLAALPHSVRAHLGTRTPPGQHPLLWTAQHLVTRMEAANRASPELVRALAAVLHALKAHADTAPPPSPEADTTRQRRARIEFEFSLFLVIGLLENDCLDKGLCALDSMDFREFLAKAGASAEVTGSAIVNALYDYTFAWRGGLEPELSACSAVQGVLRMFGTYKGAFFFKASAGMGDTICTPLYQVMKARGVDFRFFHQVTGLELTADGSKIGKVQIAQQVALAPGVAEYSPLRNVNGLDCWPSEPHWDQLLGGQKLAAAGVDFEDVIDPLPPPAETLELVLGEDFDSVILGISVGALKDLCAPLVEASPRWADMVENLQTARTQAFQMWMNVPAGALGGPYVAPVYPPQLPKLPGPFGPWEPGPVLPPWSPPPPPPPAPQGIIRPILTGYLKPFDTYSDMSQLLPAEAWPQTAPPLSIAYFCSTMPDGPDGPGPTRQAAADAIAKANALSWIESALPTIWTNAGQPGGVWPMIYDPLGGVGPARFDSQFWQANINPSERYVLSLRNTLQHRMEPGDSGFDNLYLAGDWTKVPDINAGCVEVAAMSGLLAASAVSATYIPIVCSDTLYARPQYAAYAGWESLPPPPSVVQNASVYFWAFRADPDALQRFLDRSINRAADPWRLRPILDHVFFSSVKSNALSPGVPPWSQEGTAEETDLGFWIPVAAYGNNDDIPRWLAAVPAYLLVDNGFTTASGREIWGFPKYQGLVSAPDAPHAAGPFTASALVIPKFGQGSQASLQQIIQMQASESLFLPLKLPLFELIKRLAPAADADSMAALQAAHANAPPTGGFPAPVLFLKQFRTADSATDAAYQSVLAGSFKVQDVASMGLVLGRWQLELTETDSLPFIRDLGLGAPGSDGKLVLNTEAALWAQADFSVGLAEDFRKLDFLMSLL